MEELKKELVKMGVIEEKFFIKPCKNEMWITGNGGENILAKLKNGFYTFPATGANRFCHALEKFKTAKDAAAYIYKFTQYTTEDINRIYSAIFLKITE